MKMRSKILVSILVMILCLPFVGITDNVDAAQFNIPYTVTKNDLTTNKGSNITGKDIVDVGYYLAGKGFEYKYDSPKSVGECTGFATRVLRFLEIDLRLASKPSQAKPITMDSIYTLDNWDVPGAHHTNPDRWEVGWPTDFKKVLEEMVSEGKAEYIGKLRVESYNITGVFRPGDEDNDSKSLGSGLEGLDKLGIQDGDFLITPELKMNRDYPNNWPKNLPPCDHSGHGEKEACRDGHVGFACIINDHARSLGAGSKGIYIGDIANFQGDKSGDTYVYRFVPATGDVKIIKQDEHGQRIKGVKIRLTDSNGNEVGVGVTDDNGELLFEKLKKGDYLAEETEVPEKMAIDRTKKTVTVVPNDTVQIIFSNKYKKGAAVLHKVNKDYGIKLKGDASLEGAVYRLYAAENIVEGKTTVYTINQEITEDLVTDKNGYTRKIENLPFGKYYYKEIKPSEGHLLDEEKISVTIEDDKTNEVEGKCSSIVHKEDGIYGRVKVVKFDESTDGSTIKNPAVGAVLKLELKKDPSQFYLATIKENGETEFFDEDYKKSHPDKEDTIPYGVYVISEVKASDDGEHYVYFIQKDDIVIDEPNEREYRTISDNDVEFYPRIRKIDADTNEEVHMAGFTYKIWEIGKGWVKQYDTENDKWITEFTTNETGVVVTPEKLSAGKYVFYEVDCPKGYYIPEKYRLPANESDYGNSSTSGVYVDATKAALLIPEDQEANDEDVYAEIPMKDPQLKGQIKLYKEGEVLTDVTIKNEEVAKEELYTPKYENRALEGITFKIYANEDIYSPDARIKLHSKGDPIDTITTGEDGYATSKALYLGEYRIEEEPVEGYKTSDDIIVRLTNEDKYNEVKVTPVTVENVRQKLYVKVKKIFEDSMYNDIDLSDKSAIFTVRAKEPISNYQGKEVIHADALVSVIEFENNHQVSEDVDLPAGTYEIEEIYASAPYEKIKEVRTVVLKGDATGETEVDFEEEFTNDYVKKELYIIKFSASSFIDADKIGLVGETVRADLVESEIAKFIAEVKGMTPDQVSKIIEEKALVTKDGAKYAIYKDEACTEPLVNKETNEQVIIQTGINGMYNLSGIAEGVYYVKEIEAPVYKYEEIEIPYKLSKEPIMIDIREDSSANNMVFRGLWDEHVTYPAVEKVDIFTGEPVPNCTFEVLNADKEVIFHATTNENGEAGMPLDKLENGATYYFKEITAPGVYYKDGILYELNTKEHKFVADYEVKEDGQIIFKNKVKIENYRPTSKVTFIKVDAESGELIPNCKFELRSKETDYVLTGVTDENGIYVFENVPYGEYTYTELEAPEEYMIDTTPHDVTIDSETMDLKVPNTLKDQPDTGDIDVVALSTIAMISIVTILYIVFNNKKVIE